MTKESATASAITFRQGPADRVDILLMSKECKDGNDLGGKFRFEIGKFAPNQRPER